MKKISFFIVVLVLFGMNAAMGQWGTNGNHIYNSNTGNVGIGINTPGYLLHVSKNMVAPSIRIQNAGGTGGAAFEMIDNFSGADWKFKATNAGGFKIRDHANGLDVFFIEQNSAANLLYLKSGGNIGIGTNTPDNSALLDMTSTTKGLLPPRMTQSEIAAISNPANGLVVFCTTDSKFYAYTQIAYAWREISFGSGSIYSPFYCGDPIIRSHVAGNVAPVTKTVTYSAVANIPGEPSKCWITSNLGADHQASAVDDATEASAGWYWQFNRKQGYKHDGSTVTPSWTITSIDEDSDWLAANDPCTLELGSVWRLPTLTEWTNVDASGGWIDWNGPWSSDLKMHSNGWLEYNNGSLSSRGTAGIYWSSTQSSSIYSTYISFTATTSYINEYLKTYGYGVRCLKE